MHRRPVEATLLLGTAFVMAALVGAAGSHAGAESRAGTIAFLRFPAGAGTQEASLFVIKADGIGLRRLTPLARSSGRTRGHPTGASSPTRTEARSGSSALTEQGEYVSFRGRN